MKMGDKYLLLIQLIRSNTKEIFFWKINYQITFFFAHWYIVIQTHMQPLDISKVFGNQDWNVCYEILFCSSVHCLVKLRISSS